MKNNVKQVVLARKDSGLTEFNNVATYTTVCIGPWINSEIDLLTGHLKLLK